jgi:hypothetical protein
MMNLTLAASRATGLQGKAPALIMLAVQVLPAFGVTGQ